MAIGNVNLFYRILVAQGLKHKAIEIQDVWKTRKINLIETGIQLIFSLTIALIFAL